MTATPDVSPWKLGGLSVWQLASRTWHEINDDEVFDRAAALAYYLLFAVFPTLLFFTALASLLPVERLIDHFIGYAHRLLPDDAASIATKTLAEITSGQRKGLLSIGVLAALWSGSAGMASAMAALNIAYDVDDTRPWWKRRLVAVALTVGFAVFVTMALVVMVLGPQISSGIAKGFGLGTVFASIWSALSIPIAVMFVLTAIALVYYLAPAKEMKWRWVTPGSVLALVLWLVMSFGLRIYVSRFGNYGATYGSIGGVVLLMLWFYLTSLALLVGAEVNSEIEHAGAQRGVPDAAEKGERSPDGSEEGAPAARAGGPGRLTIRIINQEIAQ